MSRTGKPVSTRDVYEGRGSIDLGEHHEGDFNTYFGHKIFKLRQKNAVVDSELESKIFDRCYILINGLTVPPIAELRRLIRVNGGVAEQYPTPNVTHIVTNSLTEAQVQQLIKSNTVKASHRLPEKFYVTVDWVLHSIRAKHRLPECDFASQGLPRVKAKPISNFFANRSNSAQQEAAVDQSNTSTDEYLDMSTAIDNMSTFELGELTTSMDDFGSEELLSNLGVNEPIAAVDSSVNSTERMSPPTLADPSNEENYDGSCSDILFQPTEADAQHIDSEQASDNLPEQVSTSRNVLDSGNTTETLDENSLIPSIFNPFEVPFDVDELDSNTGTSNNVNSNTITNTNGSRRSIGDLTRYYGTAVEDYTTDKVPNFLQHFFSRSRLHFIGQWRSRLSSIAAKAIALAKVNPNPNPYPANNQQTHIILHVDLDCFFVSALTRSRPELRDGNIPVAVAHSAAAGSSEISSCNYAARAFGVRNGMFMRSARALCPQLTVLPYDFALYTELSERFYMICFSSGAIAVEPVSVDECYVEFIVDTNNGDGIGAAMAIAERLRSRVWQELDGCTASVGIGANKLIARLATKRAKPNGAFSFESTHRSRNSKVSPSIGIEFDGVVISPIDEANSVAKTDICHEDMHVSEDEEDEDDLFGSISFSQKPIATLRAQARSSHSNRNADEEEEAPGWRFPLPACAIGVEHLQELKLSDLPGVGYQLNRKLKSAAMTTCADIWKHSLRVLQDMFGSSTGQLLFYSSRAIDPVAAGNTANAPNITSSNRPTMLQSEISPPKSIGCDINWGIRFRDATKAITFYMDLVREVSSRLQQVGRHGYCITVKLRQRAEGADRITSKFLGCGVCTEVSKSVTTASLTGTRPSTGLQRYVYSEESLAEVALPLFARMIGVRIISNNGVESIGGGCPVEDLRGLGLHVSKLETHNAINDSSSSGNTGNAKYGGIPIRNYFTTPLGKQPQRSEVVLNDESNNKCNGGEESNVQVVTEPSPQLLRQKAAEQDYTVLQLANKIAIDQADVIDITEEIRCNNNPSDAIASASICTNSSNRKVSPSECVGDYTLTQQNFLQALPGDIREEAQQQLRMHKDTLRRKQLQQQVQQQQQKSIKEKERRNAKRLSNGNISAQVNTSNNVTAAKRKRTNDTADPSKSSATTGPKVKQMTLTQGLRPIEVLDESSNHSNGSNASWQSRQQSEDWSRQSLSSSSITWSKSDCASKPRKLSEIEQQTNEDDEQYVEWVSGDSCGGALQPVRFDDMLLCIRQGNDFRRRSSLEMLRELREHLLSISGVNSERQFSGPADDICIYYTAYVLWLTDSEQLDHLKLFIKGCNRNVSHILQCIKQKREKEFLRMQKQHDTEVPSMYLTPIANGHQVEGSPATVMSDTKEVGETISLLTYVQQHSTLSKLSNSPISQQITSSSIPAELAVDATATVQEQWERFQQQINAVVDLALQWKYKSRTVSLC